jgi:predicted nucleotidyltransferase
LPARSKPTIFLYQMVRDQVLSRLRAHEAELRAAGIVRLSLFGSVARNESRPDSDIDLLATFDDSRELSLLDVIGIENKLADLLGHRVDLVEEDMLKPRVRRSVEREIIRAF